MKDNMMNREHYERIYAHFKEDYPLAIEHIKGYRPIGDHKIRIEFDDRPYFDYTFIDGGYGRYIRERPKTRDDITREYVHNEFADKLRDMMNRRGFTQLSLAEATGISQGVISGYLRRNNAYGEYAQKKPINPSIDKVYLIAWALGCDPYELL